MEKFLIVFIISSFFLVGCGETKVSQKSDTDSADIDVVESDDNGRNDDSVVDSDGADFCGDGVINGIEVCELGEKADCSKIDASFSVGDTICKDDCSGYDTSTCALSEMVKVDAGILVFDYSPVLFGTDHDFLIGKYEVTFSQYDIFVEQTSYNSPDDMTHGRGENPVFNVTWVDAIRYANWKSEQDGLGKVYDDACYVDLIKCLIDRSQTGYRLPTAAEWLFASRGGRNGEDTLYSGSDDLDSVAWYYDNAGFAPRNVGIKAPNELGIYDMTGNLTEMTEEVHSIVDDDFILFVGGDWSTSAEDILREFFYFRALSPDFKTAKLGFRLVRTLQEYDCAPSYVQDINCGENQVETQLCNESGEWEDSVECRFHYIEETVLNDPVIIDNTTQYTWTPYKAAPMIWEDAVSYCDSLDYAGGNWKLPSIQELKTILDTNIITTPPYSEFPGIDATRLWSSSAELAISKVFVLSLETQAIYGVGKTEMVDVMCVR